MVVNLDSGQGVCYNAGESLYGASSIKATYATFLCSQCVESGTLSLEDGVPFAYMDYNPVDPDEWDNPYCLGRLIQNAVVLSDNSAYESLRNYDYLGFNDWMYNLGVGDILYSSMREWYPHYSAAQGFILWANIYSYLQSGTDTATWLQEQLHPTEVSFLRDGLGDQAEVLASKAGWDWDADPDFNTMTDCGILQADGSTYLVVIHGNMSGVESNFPLMEQLVSGTVGTCLDALA